MLYGIGTSGETVAITCNSRKVAVRLYECLSSNAFRMGNPSNIIPAEVATRTDNQMTATGINSEAETTTRQLREKSAGQAGVIDGYRFGKCNGDMLEFVYCDEREVLSRGYEELKPYLLGDDIEALDKTIWKLIFEWECTHRGLSAARCAAVAVINYSQSSIILHSVKLLTGNNLIVMGPNIGYDEKMKCLDNNGFIVIFAWAHNVTPLEAGHLKLNVSTTAFTAEIGSRPRESAINSEGGFTSGFLEKTVSEWWGKFAIIVN